jgi:hypothetical protein
LWRHGRKKLGFPLGWAAARWTCALAVHDQQLNRLLIAEHLATTKPDGALCEAGIERMNRFRQEPA